MSEARRTLESPREVATTNAVRHRTFLPLAEPCALVAMRRLVDLARSTRVDPGDVLAHEGQADRRCSLVVWGALGCSLTFPAGRRAVVEVLGPGDLLAASPLAIQPALPEVRALSPARLLVWPAAVLAEALHRDHALRDWFEERLTARLHRAHRLLSRALVMPLAERLEYLLVDLAEAHGRPVPGGRRIRVPVTQDTLAAAAGATRESVNRALRALESAGRIARSGRLYTVADEPLRTRARAGLETSARSRAFGPFGREPLRRA